MMLTVGSLFSGIGGIDAGLEQTGRFHIAWQIENNAYRQQVLARHWPDTPRFGDIRDCGTHNLAPVDVLAGGFPCQDISLAGKRAGIAGERSGLWSHVARLVRELRPRYVLVENVAALLTPTKRGGELQYQAFLGTWPRAGMMRNGNCYQRRPLVPRTDGNASFLWPTPTRTDYKRYSRNPGYLVKYPRRKTQLPIAVALQPGGKTPQGFYGRLNPEWVEWLMGFPIGWSALQH